MSDRVQRGGEASTERRRSFASRSQLAQQPLCRRHGESASGSRQAHLAESFVAAPPRTSSLFRPGSCRSRRGRHALPCLPLTRVRSAGGYCQPVRLGGFGHAKPRRGGDPKKSSFRHTRRGHTYRFSSLLSADWCVVVESSWLAWPSPGHGRRASISLLVARAPLYHVPMSPGMTRA